VTAFATVLAPVSWSPAIELGNNTWTKKILPIGSIDYQGRKLNFTRSYLQGLVRAFTQRAYDAVPLQFADAANAHTNDPERTRGWITGMELADDGLWVTAEMSDRGSAVLRENPQLGVSARIVEQYARSDGAFFPAAIQHVLATLDPRIPGLGAWQAVEMNNSQDGPAIVIDLSASRWPGEAAMELAALDTLSDAELADLEQAISEADAEFGELEALLQAAVADAGFTEFDTAFNARAAADAARQDAIAAAIVEDTMHPARRDEDRMARLMQRAADGVYDTDPALTFANESRAMELAVASGQAPCGPTDEFGRCSARYHQLDCHHGQTVDWLASGPPRRTYENSLRAWSNSINLAGTPVSVYDDPDDPDAAPSVIPQRTVELAHELASDWGLLDDTPGRPDVTSAMDLLRPETPLTAYDSLAEPIGAPLRDGGPSVLGYPGISELARDLGLK
jgi:hypothetical protein